MSKQHFDGEGEMNGVKGKMKASFTSSSDGPVTGGAIAIALFIGIFAVPLAIFGPFVWKASWWLAKASVALIVGTIELFYPGIFAAGIDPVYQHEVRVYLDANPALKQEYTAKKKYSTDPVCIGGLCQEK